MRVIVGLVGVALGLSLPGYVVAAKPHFAFGVISGTMRSAADEAATRRLLEAAGAEQNLSFVVYDGNLKGAAERCDDSVYEQRQQVLATSRLPVVFIPGQHDWADCDSRTAGGYDVTERLDFLRQALFSNNTSLGEAPLTLARESDVARFHGYRENVRWQFGETVFVGLNVVSGNNHYLDAGGRNGEYDDRAIATAFWLEHSAEYARRRNAEALVVFVEADPEFERYERAERFAWLRLGRRRPRDGYLEFKRSLVKAAQIFRGPVIVIHETAARLPRGFTIDQPLFDDKGDRLSNLTRIAIGLREPVTQWIKTDVNYAKSPPLIVSVRQIPKIPHEAPTAPPTPSEDASPASTSSASGIMPAPPPIPPGAPSSEPPLLPERPDVPAPPGAPSQMPPGASGAGSMQGGI